VCDWFVLNSDRPEPVRLGFARGFLEQLVRIQQVDWRAHGLDAVLKDPGTGAAAAELDRWEGELRRVALEPVPELELVLRWLRERVRPSARTVLVHGDFKPGNALLVGERISAMLDWETAHLGDPLCEGAPDPRSLGAGADRRRLHRRDRPGGRSRRADLVERLLLLEALGDRPDRPARVRRGPVGPGAPQPDLARAGHVADDRGGGPMRPTIAEQLAGTCRALERVASSEVEGTPAAEVLRGLVKNLRMLETSWSAILPFLHWDLNETTALLARAHGAVPEPLRARIDTALAGQPVDPLDVGAVEARDDMLRALLTEVVLAVDPLGTEYAAIAAHLDERARRYPLRMVPDVPTARS
jgi:hypothetical protein